MNADAVDRLVAVGDLADALATAASTADDERAVALDRAGVRLRDPRVVADLVEFLVAEREGKLLNAERIGPRLVEDRVLHRRVQARMSDTTAMIDVTATMLPSTVISDRSLEAQIACERDAGRLENLFIDHRARWTGFGGSCRDAACPLERARPRLDSTSPCRASGRGRWRSIRVVALSDFDRVAVRHAADRVVRAGHDLVARLEALEHLEVPVAGDAHLDRDELHPAVAHDEHAFGFLARLPGLQLRGDATGSAVRRRRRLERLLHDLAVRVVHELANGHRRNRHRRDALARRRRDVRRAGETRAHVRNVARRGRRRL